MCTKEYGCCPKFKTGDNSTYTFTKRGGMYLCKDPTDRRGGLTDLCYTNIHSEDVILSQIPVYYSDHQLLCVAVPFKVVM